MCSLPQAGQVTLAFCSSIWWRNVEKACPQWLQSCSIFCFSAVVFLSFAIAVPILFECQIAIRIAPPAYNSDNVSLGLYISVPFCRTKCSYCNFASDVFSKSAYENYVARVIEDIRNARQTAVDVGGHFDEPVDSIYLGGGTPSILDASQLLRIFEAVRSQFDVTGDAEVTVECAPGTLTNALIETLLLAGVNRVSLGVQSFVDQEAQSVGRLHKRSTVIEEIARLRENGLSNINIDLIAGLPHQTA